VVVAMPIFAVRFMYIKFVYFWFEYPKDFCWGDVNLSVLLYRAFDDVNAPRGTYAEKMIKKILAGRKSVKQYLVEEKLDRKD
jgi:hypothetical protein